MLKLINYIVGCHSRMWTLRQLKLSPTPLDQYYIPIIDKYSLHSIHITDDYDLYGYCFTASPRFASCYY